MWAKSENSATESGRKMTLSCLEEENILENTTPNKTSKICVFYDNRMYSKNHKTKKDCNMTFSDNHKK